MEQSPRLINPVHFTSAALSIDNGDKALICFPGNDNLIARQCEVFDLFTSASTHSTSFKHYGGKLGLYNGQPTTVGSQVEPQDWENRNDWKKVETLTSSGWMALTDFPRYFRSQSKNKNLLTRITSDHVLIGLPSGSLVLTGGLHPAWTGNAGNFSFAPSHGIWLLKENDWSRIGTLMKVNLDKIFKSKKILLRVNTMRLQ